MGQARLNVRSWRLASQGSLRLATLGFGTESRGILKQLAQLSSVLLRQDAFRFAKINFRFVAVTFEHVQKI